MSKDSVNIYQVVRNFLFSWLNREFLIFLFFLALSGLFWLLMALNETYEAEIPVAVRVVNVPKNVVLTTESTDTLHVTVRDKGFTIATYLYSDRMRPVSINFNQFANKTTERGGVTASDLQRLIYPQLLASSNIVLVKPDKFVFYFNYGQSKQVPVRLRGRVQPNRSYYLANTKIWPQNILVYASKKTLDSIRYIDTEELNLTNIEDTVVRNIALKKIPGVKLIPSLVKVSFYPDVLTEETVEVPIQAINMPEGKVLRTFPSKVRVRFTVGASKFRMVKPEMFVVVVDYREIENRTSEKCQLYIRSFPNIVSGIKLEMSAVDYLIEQQ